MDYLLLDGGIGSALQTLGHIDCPQLDILNVTHASDVIAVHNAFIQAGAKGITTNSFCANGQYTSAEWDVVQLNQLAVQHARTASKQAGVNLPIFGSIGPLSQPEKPMHEIHQAYEAQIETLLNEGVDYLLIETITHFREAKLAIQYAHYVDPHRPILPSLTLTTGLNLPSGESFYEVVEQLITLPIAGIGINCISEWDLLWDAVTYLRDNYPDLLILAAPNAGVPVWTGDDWQYTLSAEQFADMVDQLHAIGINIIGGCCGISAEMIQTIQMKNLTRP